MTVVEKGTGVVAVPFFYADISFTRPTSPLSKRTLIPCGCVGELVKIFFTIPFVSFPVCWSFFDTIETCNPGLMSERLLPSINCSPIIKRTDTSRFFKGLCCPFCFDYQCYTLMRLQNLDYLQNVFRPRIPSRAKHSVNTLARF